MYDDEGDNGSSPKVWNANKIWLASIHNLLQNNVTYAKFLFMAYAVFTYIKSLIFPNTIS